MLADVCEVVGGLLPSEGPGGLVVSAGEGEKSFEKCFSAEEIVRADDFLLDDGEEDLVQPRGMDRGGS